MFNPLAPFKPHYAESFSGKGVKAFVQQSYPRVPDAFVLSHYDDVGLALNHFDALKHDSQRKIYILSDENDVTALKRIVTTKKVFTRLTIHRVLEKMKVQLQKHLKAFIQYKTDLQPRSFGDVSIVLEIMFGEVYVQLKYGAKEIKVKLSEIENVKYVL